MSKIDELLEGLSEQEKDIVLRSLKEIEETGHSSTLNQIYEQDYEEIPVSIDEFIENPRYAGWMTNNGKGIYPYWREKLREIFDPSASYQEVALTGCLTGDTKVKILDDRDYTMKELSELDDLSNKKVVSFSSETCFSQGNIADAFSTGVKDVYKITLSNGRYVKATSNHLFLDKNLKWVSIDSGMKVGTILARTNIVDGSTVESIDYVGKEEVYDLTIDGYHNFYLDCGIFAHNSIGIGKSSIAIIGLAYQLYKLMCLRDPHSYYRIGKGGYIYVVFFNATLTLSQGVAYTKFQSLLQNSPWFLERGKVTGKKYLEYIPDKPIRFTVGSTIEHSLGKDIFCMSGDTVILTQDGLKKLEDISGEYHRVYSMREDGELELSEPALICCTKIVNELYEVELEDETIIRCTGEHRLKLKNGNYKRIDELTTDDELEDL